MGLEENGNLGRVRRCLNRDMESLIGQMCLSQELSRSLDVFPSDS